MNGFMNREQVARIREKYPEGTRVSVDYMPNDPRPIEEGTLGTVEFVDDIDTVHCKFDNGRFLGLIPGEDSFHIVHQEQDIFPEMSMQ